MLNFSSILWCCMICIIQNVYAVQPTFSDDVLMVEGHSTNSSDIKLWLADRNVSKIYVYLTHTFYADEDLNLNGIKELQIFARTWDITRPVTFDLSGLDGVSQDPAIKGAAGNNGNAAMDGGNFFGIANKTINGDYLTVISNGGNGGNGQDGGASDDIYTLINVDDDSGDTGWFSNGDLQNYYKKYFDDRGYDTEISDIDDYTSFYAVFVHDKKASFNVRLHPKKCCGPTGMGGVGGFGGRRGKLIFKHVGMSSESMPKLLTDDGSVGKAGKDAKPCESVALDVRIDTELKKVVFIVLPLHHSFSSTFTVLNHTNSSKCMPEYVQNNETTDPPEPIEPNDNETVQQVNRYKKFLIENMKNASLSSIVQQTYKAIDENRELNDEDTLIGLLREGCELEKNYFELMKTIKMKSLYRRLFARVEGLKSNELNQDDKQALTHLKFNLQRKLKDIRKTYNLIVNLEGYNIAVMRDIDHRYEETTNIINVSDAELQNNLNLLRFGVNGNYILSNYFHVIEGFRLAYFPFAVDYLESYRLPTSPYLYDDLEDITISTTNRLKSLTQSIWKIESENGEIMMNLNSIDYTSPDDAFFIWKNSDVRSEIQELFAGKEVKLLADVKQSDYNGMKYKSVDLVFRSSDPVANDQLNTALQSFHLELTNTGKSATRCDNNFYEITTDPLLIVTSFRRDEKDVPLTRLMTYDMIRGSQQPTLSPYTLWEVRIREENDAFEDIRNISELSSFGRYDFDIELHGTGNYVLRNSPICNRAKLAKFYPPI